MKRSQLKEIVSKLSLQTDSPVFVKGVSVDSRNTKPGDIFFALEGAKTNGHHYLQEAAARGAVAAIVHHSYRGGTHGMALLRVESPLDALQSLARSFVQTSKAKVVGITGSVGKTTTKEFLYSLLQSKYRVLVSSGNSNSQIGLPLTLLNHPDLNADILVQEMAMTEAGQISRLVNIIPPHVALITCVALVHVQYFDSIEGIARAKAEIFSHPATEMGFYHHESNYGSILSTSGSCKKRTFSDLNELADDFIYTNENQLVIRDHLQQRVVLPLLKVPGNHNRLNFLAAATVARHLGLSWEEIAQAIPTLQLPERRMQYLEKKGAIFVNDSYNAAEISTKAALSSLPQPKVGGKKIAVFGGMVEMGKFSKECHEAVAEHALGCVDTMFCFGEDCLVVKECWEKAHRPVFWGKCREDLIDLLREAVRPGDVVLLKGSRLKETWKFLDEL